MKEVHLRQGYQVGKVIQRWKGLCQVSKSDERNRYRIIPRRESVFLLFFAFCSGELIPFAHDSSYPVEAGNSHFSKLRLCIRHVFESLIEHLLGCLSVIQIFMLPPRPISELLSLSPKLSPFPCYSVILVFSKS